MSGEGAREPHDGASTPSSESRPRPAYGEYATPEEQRAAIRMPLPEAARPDAPSSPAHAAAPVVPPLPTGAPTGPLRPPHPTTSAARPSRAADRIITFALLAYGLTTVVSTVIQLWHFPEFAATFMSLAGIDGTFTNVAEGELWGRIGAVVFAVGWVVTAFVSWRSVVAGRPSWWIPLVGAIVTFVAMTACVGVAILGDPAIATHILR